MERLVEIAFHEPALGPIHGRSADPDAARDRLIRRAGIGRQQDLRPFQLAHRMLAAAQHRPPLTAFVLGEIAPVTYVHPYLPFRRVQVESLLKTMSSSVSRFTFKPGQLLAFINHNYTVQ